ncbi:hypothetical protein CEXT_510681 [Caerostris extrusa]|uniref:Uncharacterized protein n=1 Tax=Caerostris extrusa TaxID=172846 RepID=A0AAV4XSX7_CAEEX|nr:hypothetical protein CEXT_510681 [Caerostris extrusa]
MAKGGEQTYSLHMKGRAKKCHGLMGRRLLFHFPIPPRLSFTVTDQLASHTTMGAWELAQKIHRTGEEDLWFGGGEVGKKGLGWEMRMILFASTAVDRNDPPQYSCITIPSFSNKLERRNRMKKYDVLNGKN